MKKKLLLAAMGLSALTPGCVKTDGQGDVTTDPQVNSEVSAKKVDVERLLKRLPEKPAPKELRMGAMCYKVAMPPERAEYVCPACGNKTLHVLKHQDRWSAPVLSIKEYRDGVEQLNKLGLVAKLDESFLCSSCNKDGRTSLFLEVTVNGRVVRNAIQSYGDLRKLIAFVQGELVWKGDRDAEYPLKPELPRIRQLLGVKE